MKKIFLPILFIIVPIFVAIGYVAAQTETVPPPQPSFVSAILFNIFVILSTAFIVVLSYSLRSNTSDFDPLCWIKTNYFRFITGAILGIFISVLVVVSPDADALFQIIGFNASKTPISIGLALGAALIAGVNGNKAEK